MENRTPTVTEYIVCSGKYDIYFHGQTASLEEIYDTMYEVLREKGYALQNYELDPDEDGNIRFDGELFAYPAEEAEDGDSD